MGKHALNVLYPVETANREFDYRLFLAVLHAHADNQIFIGQHDILFDVATRMKGGVYFGKHIFRSYFPTDVSRYERIKKNGFVYVNLHEEGAIFPGEADFWRHLLDLQLDTRVLDPTDHICTWGEFQRDHYLRKSPPNPDHVHATGHPRFDMYKQPYRQLFEPDAKKLRERFGNFILVNTNMTTANYAAGRRDTFLTYAGWPSSSASERLSFIGYWAHTTAILTHFVKLVFRLSIERPDLTVIVRPHPTEDMDFYRDAFVHLPNVKVIYDGPVSPWILASRAMIHDGCTTGVEGFLLGTPTINFKAIEDPKHDLFLPNRLGWRCETEADVLAAIDRVLAAEMAVEPPAVDRDVQHLMQNFSSDSIALMLDVMRAAENLVGKTPTRPSSAQLKWRERLRDAEMAARALVRPFFPERMAAHAHYKTYFPPLDQSRVREKLQRIQTILDRDVRVEFHGPKLMSIRAAG